MSDPTVLGLIYQGVSRDRISIEPKPRPEKALRGWGADPCQCGSGSDRFGGHILKGVQQFFCTGMNQHRAGAAA